MKPRHEMEEYLGMSRAQAEQEAHPPLICAECGSEEVAFVPAEKEMGFVRIPEHLECQDCGHTGLEGFCE